MNWYNADPRIDNFLDRMEKFDFFGPVARKPDRVLFYNKPMEELVAEVTLKMKEDSGSVSIYSTILNMTPDTGPLVYYFIGYILINLGHHGFDFHVNSGDFYLWKHTSFDRDGFEPHSEAEKTQRDLRFLAEVKRRFSWYSSCHLVMRKN